MATKPYGGRLLRKSRLRKKAMTSEVSLQELFKILHGIHANLAIQEERERMLKMIPMKDGRIIWSNVQDKPSFDIFGES